MAYKYILVVGGFSDGEELAKAFKTLSGARREVQSLAKEAAGNLEIDPLLAVWYRISTISGKMIEEGLV